DLRDGGRHHLLPATRRRPCQRLRRCPVPRLVRQRRLDDDHARNPNRQTKRTNAPRLRTLRTACKRAHRFRRSPASCDLVSKAGSRSLLFVGKITSKVNGITEPSATPPINHPSPLPLIQAAAPTASPQMASNTCRKVARW